MAEALIFCSLFKGNVPLNNEHGDVRTLPSKIRYALVDIRNLQ